MEYEYIIHSISEEAIDISYLDDYTDLFSGLYNAVQGETNSIVRLTLQSGLGFVSFNEYEIQCVFETEFENDNQIENIVVQLSNKIYEITGQPMEWQRLI